MNPELRERLALFMTLIHHGTRWDEWPEQCLTDGYRDKCLAEVDAILTELEAAGWPATPILPTEEMVEAGDEAAKYSALSFIEGTSAPIFSAMLRARPKI